jgi:hypothetical protein
MILGKGFAGGVDVLNGWVEIVAGLHRRCILYWSRVLHGSPRKVMPVKLFLNAPDRLGPTRSSLSACPHRVNNKRASHPLVDQTKLGIFSVVKPVAR